MYGEVFWQQVGSSLIKGTEVGPDSLTLVPLLVQAPGPINCWGRTMAAIGLQVQTGVSAGPRPTIAVVG